MDHLIEIKDNAIKGKRIVGCVYDDGKIPYEHAFAVNGDKDLFIIAPCQVCYASIYYKIKSGEVPTVFSETESKSIVYRGFVLRCEYGYDFDKPESESVQEVLKQIDEYIFTGETKPMFLLGIRIYKIGVEPD